MQRLAAVDVGQLVHCFTSAGIASLGQDRYLEFRRIPAFGNDVDVPLIPDLASGYGHGGARAFRLNTFNHPGAKLFDLGCVDRLRLLKWCAPIRRRAITILSCDPAPEVQDPHRDGVRSLRRIARSLGFVRCR